MVSNSRFQDRLSECIAFATARLNVRTNTLSNTVLLSRRTCCCLLDPAGAEFCLTARYTQVQTRNRTGSGLKQTEHL
jgi:hypothetical protein